MLGKLRYIFDRKDKVKILLILIAVMIGSFFELLGVAIFTPFVNVIMDPASIQNTEMLRVLYEWGKFSQSRDFLAAIAGAIIFIYIFKNIFMALEKNWIYKFSYGIQKKISVRLLKSYIREPYTFHLNKNIAVLQRSLQEDTDLFTKGIIHAMELIAEITVCGVLGIFCIWRANPSRLSCW